MGWGVKATGGGALTGGAGCDRTRVDIGGFVRRPSRVRDAFPGARDV